MWYGTAVLEKKQNYESRRDYKMTEVKQVNRYYGKGRDTTLCPADDGECFQTSKNRGMGDYGLRKVVGWSSLNTDTQWFGTAVSTSAPVVGTGGAGKIGIDGLDCWPILDAVAKYFNVNHTLFSYQCITLSNTH